MYLTSIYCEIQKWPFFSISQRASFVVHSCSQILFRISHNMSLKILFSYIFVLSIHLQETNTLKYRISQWMLYQVSWETKVRVNKIFFEVSSRWELRAFLVTKSLLMSFFRYLTAFGCKRHVATFTVWCYPPHSPIHSLIQECACDLCKANCRRAICLQAARFRMKLILDALFTMLMHKTLYSHACSTQKSLAGLANLRKLYWLGLSNTLIIEAVPKPFITQLLLSPFITICLTLPL